MNKTYFYKIRKVDLFVFQLYNNYIDFSQLNGGQATAGGMRGNRKKHFLLPINILRFFSPPVSKADIPLREGGLS